MCTPPFLPDDCTGLSPADKRPAQEMVPLDFHFLAGCHPATSAAPDVWLPKRYGRIGERRCSLIILPEGAVQRERAGRA